MKAYTVYGYLITPFSYDVEADSEDEARAIAEDADPSDFEYTDWAQEIRIENIVDEGEWWEEEMREDKREC